MKKFFNLVVLAFALAPSWLFAAELTADTVAVPETSLWVKLIVAAISSFVATVTGIVGSAAYDALKKYLANSRYGQETGVILEATRVAALRKAKERGIEYHALLKEIGAMATDLTLDDTERERIKAIRDQMADIAKEIATEQLKQIRGFAKDAAGKWVGERVDLMLGELASRALGLPEI